LVKCVGRAFERVFQSPRAIKNSESSE
jgi:hypothetical protein